jgi:16S rRNA (uracil1498-N3)-methyltransferase
MSYQRFFLHEPLAPGAEGLARLPFSAADMHHALDVLRIVPGERIVVVEPRGTAWLVLISEVEGRSLIGRAVRTLAEPATSPDLTLIQGIAKGPTMDAIVQHAVELGAVRITPVFTERTIVRLDAEKSESRTARWRRIAAGAARQSQQVRIPTVDTPQSLGDVSSTLSDFDAVLVLWEESDGQGVVDAIGATHLTARSDSDGGAAEGPRVALVIGPEGGLTQAEVGALVGAGAVVCSLGHNILRAETASLAAMTLAAFALGGMGAAPSGEGLGLADE